MTFGFPMLTEKQFEIDVCLLASELLEQEPMHTGEWQSMDTSASTRHATYELMNFVLDRRVPESIAELQTAISPSTPWAENHFRERVGGEPLNPGEEYKNWPWYKGNVETHKPNGQFSHTYMERFWPKLANPDETMVFRSGRPAEMNVGIRFAYGDLQDVVWLLIKSPLTRQAYLPVWFPEDTGAVHGQRVPCSLGYHFMIRDGFLNCWYTMRSCDLIRHFRDDVYLAARLMQWMCKQYNGREFGDDTPLKIGEEAPVKGASLLKPGNLHMTVSSLHAFTGDQSTLERMATKGDDESPSDES